MCSQVLPLVIAQAIRQVGGVCVRLCRGQNGD